jgi:hypothetical protein
MAHIDRPPEAFERELDDLDCPIDAGAETSRGRD